MRNVFARKESAIFLLLVVLCGLTAWKFPVFVSPVNLQNNARLIGLYGIFSLGMGFIIVTGGIDLSVGSLFALLGVVLAMMLGEKGFNPWVAVTLTMALAAAVGTLHGFLVARVRLQPFIVTLCGLLVYRGLARLFANDETKGFGNAEGFELLQQTATGSLFGFPTPFILLILLSVILWFVLHRSVYGRHLLAVGRNEDAARYAGIETRRVIAGTYILMGVLAGFAGILFAFYTNSIGPSNYGNSFELYAIAAAVLGGCSLRGGEGSVIGILLGTILLRVIQNVVNLTGVSSALEPVVLGTVILIGVLADRLLGRRRTA